jgi:hypothetical protein
MNNTQTETGKEGPGKGHEKKTRGRTRLAESRMKMGEKKEGRRRERGSIGGESRQNSTRKLRHNSVRVRAGRMPRSSPLLTCLSIHG